MQNPCHIFLYDCQQEHSDEPDGFCMDFTKFNRIVSCLFTWLFHSVSFLVFTASIVSITLSSQIRISDSYLSNLIPADCAHFR